MKIIIPLWLLYMKLLCGKCDKLLLIKYLKSCACLTGNLSQECCSGDIKVEIFRCKLFIMLLIMLECTYMSFPICDILEKTFMLRCSHYLLLSYMEHTYCLLNHTQSWQPMMPTHLSHKLFISLLIYVFDCICITFTKVRHMCLSSMYSKDFCVMNFC